MTGDLRIELFVADLDEFVRFYTEVLGFELRRDERAQEHRYVYVTLGEARFGAVPTWEPVSPAERHTPRGPEIVLEVDDLIAARDRVIASGWPLAEDLQDRPWGLTDFRLHDPDGHFLRVTTRG